MQLTKLSIDSFLQIKAMDLDLSEAPVHLICGHNECGKSSIHEAIRYAMLGETDRVSLKREYPLMVRAGAKTASVRIDFVDNEGNHDFIARDVGSGKVTDGDDTDPQFGIDTVMDATKYPLMDPKHQRTFLTDLLQIRIDRGKVRANMLRKGLPESFCEILQPMLRAGFDPTHKEAKSQQSQARARWEQLTGEKWGSTKGGEWKPEKRPVIQAMRDAASREAEKYRLAYNSALENLGEVKAHQGGFGGPCPNCETMLVWSGRHMKLQSDEPTREELGDAAKAAKEVEGLEKVWVQERERVAQMEADIEFNGRMAEIQVEAQEINAEILNWMMAAEMLAPDGIPSQMIAEELKPINERLRETSIATSWEQVVITPTVQITIGSLPYSLCSESSQWRAQAAIAEAISTLGELGILCLDRIDVLDIPNRARLLKWINSVADQHNTILLFGTLKEKPQKLPGTFSVHWLDRGEELTDAPF